MAKVKIVPDGHQPQIKNVRDAALPSHSKLVGQSMASATKGVKGISHNKKSYNEDMDDFAMNTSPNAKAHQLAEEGDEGL